MDSDRTLPPMVNQHPRPVRPSVECIPLAPSETYTCGSQYFEDRPDPGFGAQHIEMEVTVQGTKLDLRGLIPRFLSQA